MNLEDIGREFPEMPEEMREMIKQKVAEQTKTGNFRRRRKNYGRMAAAIFAAALALGTTVYAGTKLYRMYTEQVGTYAVKTVVPDDISESADSESTAYKNAAVKAGYLPEGMVESDDGYQFYYEDQPWVGGISIVMFDMDSEDDFEVLDTDILERETISVSGHEAVFLTRRTPDGDGDSFNRILYISYPEADLMVKVYAAQNVSREETLKFAEGLELVELGDDMEVRHSTWSWSDYIVSESETEYYEQKLSASKEEMKNTHTVGETFSLKKAPAFDENGVFTGQDTVAAEVESVQVFDDIGLLEPEYLEYSWKNWEFNSNVDSEGRLLPNKISYIRSGDGVDTIDEILKTETVEQKLIYVTVNYTNTGDSVLPNLCYSGHLLKIQELEKEFVIYDRAKQGENGGWDRTSGTGYGSFGICMYYDVRDEESNGGNYITNLQPGETAVVHMGFLVNADELDYLYLDLAQGSELAFSDISLNVGYVDIRQ